MVFLTKVIEEYRADNEPEAAQLVEEAKHSALFTLDKYSCAYKAQKSKGEIVDEYYLVTLTKVITDPKEPLVQVDVEYTLGGVMEIDED